MEGSGRGLVMVECFWRWTKKEKKRLSRVCSNTPKKKWKFATADIAERERWNEYMTAYEEMIQHTATPHAPWYVVPADKKWYTRLVVSAAIIDALEELNLRYPGVGAAQRKELKDARAALEHEGNHH